METRGFLKRKPGGSTFFHQGEDWSENWEKAFTNWKLGEVPVKIVQRFSTRVKTGQKLGRKLLYLLNEKNWWRGRIIHVWKCLKIIDKNEIFQM